MSDFSAFAATSITVDELVPGFKSLFKCTIPDSGKVKLIFTCLWTISIINLSHFNYWFSCFIWLFSGIIIVGTTTLEQLHWDYWVHWIRRKPRKRIWPCSKLIRSCRNKHSVSRRQCCTWPTNKNNQQAECWLRPQHWLPCCFLDHVRYVLQEVQKLSLSENV